VQNRKYFGCRLYQRTSGDAVALFSFQVRVKDLRQWTGIKRIAEVPEGTQRLLRKSRVKAIARFLGASAINTIPNSILIAFDNGVTAFQPATVSECVNQNVDVLNGCDRQAEWGVLSFQFDDALHEHMRPALIVDGQHRVHGISSYQDEDMPVLVTALLDAEMVEQAFQFIAINDKSVHIAKADAKAILARFEDGQEETLRQRLLSAGVDYKDESPILKELDELDISPFKSMLDWQFKMEGAKVVPITALEQAIRYIRNLVAALASDRDSQLEILCAIWRAVKQEYPNLWNGQSKLLTKVSIVALTEYIGHRLKISWEFDMFDIFDPADAERFTSKLLKSVPEQFWADEWTVRVQDNANVRQAIKDDLETMAANYRSDEKWNNDLKLLKLSE